MDQISLATTLFYDPAFLDHKTGSDHPERPARLEAVVKAVRAAFGEVVFHSPAEVEREALLTVHDRDYVAALENICARGGGDLDNDTVVSKGSFKAAMLAAGAACAVVDGVVAGNAPASAFALVRPPGHHALQNRAMGFCLFNNIAVAARYAQQKYSVERVLIVDWDVHHGNGTQDTFYADPSVAYFSTHEYHWPFFPGTGAANETGSGAARGTNCNVPLPAGSSDSEYIAAFEQVLVPFARALRPQLILVSAGFDAHQREPLAMMNMDTSGYAALTTIVMRLAGELCPNRLGFVLEGGYDLQALGASVVTTLQTLNGATSYVPQRPAKPAVQRLLEQIRAIHNLG